MTDDDDGAAVCLSSEDAHELVGCLLECAERLALCDYSAAGDAAVDRARAILGKITGLADEC